MGLACHRFLENCAVNAYQTARRKHEAREAGAAIAGALAGTFEKAAAAAEAAEAAAAAAEAAEAAAAADMASTATMAVTKGMTKDMPQKIDVATARKTMRSDPDFL